MTESEYLAALRVIDAVDATIPQHERFQLRDELARRLTGDGSADSLREEVRFEVLLFLSHPRALPQAFETFHEALRTAAGLDWALRQLHAPRSALVRAGAGWLLWASQERAHRRHAQAIATAHAEAVELLSKHALSVGTSGAAIEAVHALSTAIEVARQTRQGGSLFPRLLNVGLQFAAEATSIALERWCLDIANGLSSIPLEILRSRISDIERLTARLELRSGRTEDGFLIQRGFLLSAHALRESAGLGESTTHGRRAVAKLLEEDGLRGEPLRGIASLREAVEAYRLLGDAAEDVRRVQRLLEERLRDAREQLPLVATDIQVPRAEIELVVSRYRRVSVHGALIYLTIDPNLRMDPDAMREESDASDAQFLHRQLFPALIFQGDGTTLRPHTEEGQRRLRALMDAAQHQQLVSHLFLTPIFDLLWEHGMTPDDVVRTLMDDSVFPPSERPFIERGVRHWAEGDFISSLSVLVPRVERALRRLAAEVGENTTAIRPDSDQRLLLGTVLDRLTTAAGDDASRSLFFELRVFLDGDGGRAIRHEIAHGLAEAGIFTREANDTLIALMLRIASLSHVTKAPSVGISADVPPRD